MDMKGWMGGLSGPQFVVGSLPVQIRSIAQGSFFNRVEILQLRKDLSLQAFVAQVSFRRFRMSYKWFKIEA